MELNNQRKDSISDPEIEILDRTSYRYLDKIIEKTDSDTQTRPVAKNTLPDKAEPSPTIYKREYTSQEIKYLDGLVEKHCCNVHGITDIAPYMKERQNGGLSRAYGGFEYVPGNEKVCNRILECMKAVPYFIKLAINGDSGIMMEEGRNHEQISKKTRAVPQVYFVDEIKLADGRELPLIAMENINGEELNEYVTRKEKEGKPLTERDKLAMFRRIVLAVGEVHKAGYVHRDIKPENILIPKSNDENVRIVDMGLSSEKGNAPKNSSLTGTPAYMSPEHLENKVDERMDIYSLGCVLYELLTGRTPYGHVIADSERKSPEHISENLPSKLYAEMLKGSAITEPSPEVKKKLEELCRDTASIVSKCMKRNPEERWKDCDELANELDQATTMIDLTYKVMQAFTKQDEVTDWQKVPQYQEAVAPIDEALVDAAASMICPPKEHSKKSVAYFLMFGKMPQRTIARIARGGSVTSKRRSQYDIMKTRLREFRGQEQRGR